MAIFMYVPEVSKFQQENQWMFWVAFVMTFVLVIVLGCCQDFRRRWPLNIILLLLFTFCEGFLLGTISTLYRVLFHFLTQNSSLGQKKSLLRGTFLSFWTKNFKICVSKGPKSFFRVLDALEPRHSNEFAQQSQLFSSTRRHRLSNEFAQQSQLFSSTRRHFHYTGYYSIFLLKILR